MRRNVIELTHKGRPKRLIFQSGKSTAERNYDQRENLKSSETQSDMKKDSP